MLPQNYCQKLKKISVKFNKSMAEYSFEIGVRVKITARSPKEAREWAYSFVNEFKDIINSTSHGESEDIFVERIE